MNIFLNRISLPSIGDIFTIKETCSGGATGEGGVQEMSPAVLSRDDFVSRPSSRRKGLSG